MFDAVFVINLDRSADRWQSLQPVLGHMGFPAKTTRFSAFDGATLDIPSLQRQGLVFGDLAGFTPSILAGELGCALSHAAVIGEIVERRIPTALILEDDIALAGRPGTWRQRAERVFSRLPAGWELWFLYRCFDVRNRAERVATGLVRPWTPQGCAAYAVTLSGAQKLLTALRPLSSAVDRVIAPLVRDRQISAFAASPQLILPGSHPSIINAGASRKWVRNGVNRPPEYWPSRYLNALGEPQESWPRRVWEAILFRINNSE